VNRPTVLLVEDNALLRGWISSSLEEAGFSIVAPDTTAEALHLAAVRPFDVVVTDWRLGGGYDGFEVLARLRSKFPQTLSVLISADANRQLVERAQDAGFDGVLEKPFPPWKIIAALHSLIEARRMEVTHETF